MSKKLKILFIGGTGNISTSVSKLCLQKGYDLYLLNRGNNNIAVKDAKFINCDVKDQPKLREILNKYEWDTVVNWIAFDTADIERDINLFRGKTKQYIFISSASVYQKPPLTPYITESTPLYNPFWEYSRKKIACEEKLNQAYREESFPMVIIRPSLTYETVIPVPIGGWNDYNLIERLKKGKKIIVHGDGTSIWNFTHSYDFAKGFVGLLGNSCAIGNAFHITSDEILTWNQVYFTIADVLGVTPNIVHISSDFIVKIVPSLKGILLGEWSNSIIFDNSKIKKFVPEYMSKISFKEGIKKTLEWFEEEPIRKYINPRSTNIFNCILDKY